MTFCDSYSEIHIVMGGDMNCIQNITIDQKGSKNKRDNSVYTVKGFMNIFKLIDCWRVINKDKTQFTWRRKSTNLFKRLDYWFVSKSLCDAG